MVHIETSAWLISTVSATMTIDQGSRSPRLPGSRRNQEYRTIPTAASAVRRMTMGE